MKVAAGVAKQAYAGLTRKSGGRIVWTGDVRLVPEMLDQPLRWRKPRRIFVDSMSDLFHPDVPFEYIDQVFLTMGEAHWHTFQVLTKRPERMASYMSEHWYPEAEGAGIASLTRDGPLPNVWLGTSVEDQQRADERIPHLLRTPAAVRFLSCEPLLGPVDLARWVRPPEHGTIVFTSEPETHPEGSGVTIETDLIQWVIAGGESGPNARPCDVAWLRSIRDQCRDAGVPVFVKQLGARPIATAEPLPAPQSAESLMRHGEYDPDPWEFKLRDSHGGDPSEWPEDLRVREFPKDVPARYQT
jgi:protein gp37